MQNMKMAPSSVMIIACASVILIAAAGASALQSGNLNLNLTTLPPWSSCRTWPPQVQLVTDATLAMGSAYQEGILRENRQPAFKDRLSAVNQEKYGAPTSLLASVQICIASSHHPDSRVPHAVLSPV